MLNCFLVTSMLFLKAGVIYKNKTAALNLEESINVHQTKQRGNETSHRHQFWLHIKRSAIMLCLCQAAVQCPSLWVTFRPNKSLLAQTEPHGNVWLQIKHQGKSFFFPPSNWQPRVLFLNQWCLSIAGFIVVLVYCPAIKSSKVTPPLSKTYCTCHQRQPSRFKMWLDSDITSKLLWQNSET